MVIQEDTLRRVEEYLDKLRREPRNSNLIFDCHMSKSSISLYVKVSSHVGRRYLKLEYRFSDHYKSTVKTKIIKKNTKFGFIQRKIDKMIKKMGIMRYNEWSKQERRKLQ